MSVIRMSDVDLAGKRVLIREDLNVPKSDGVITSDIRIVRALPTINAAVEAGSTVMLMSHLGRPKEGQPDAQYSLQPVAERLGELLGRDVSLVRDWIDGVDVEPGDVVLLENVRFLMKTRRISTWAVISSLTSGARLPSIMAWTSSSSS